MIYRYKLRTKLISQYLSCQEMLEGMSLQCIHCCLREVLFYFYAYFIIFHIIFYFICSFLFSFFNSVTTAPTHLDTCERL